MSSAYFFIKALLLDVVLDQAREIRILDIAIRDELIIQEVLKFSHYLAFGLDILYFLCALLDS